MSKTLKMNPFKYDMVPYTRGLGVEMSADEVKTFPHFLKWDIGAISLLRPQSLDFAYFRQQEKTVDIDELKKVFALVKENGHLILITNNEVRPLDLMSRILRWSRVDFVKIDEWSMSVFKKVSNDKRKIEKPVEGLTCAIFRFGGIGDMMFASCIFPELKKQGYHVTLFTHVNSYETVKFDPYIDRFVLQDSGQVPGEDFRDFAMHALKKYDKFINLSESIEGTLMSLPDRVSYYWPTEAREKIMGRSVYQTTALIADVPVSYSGKFYATIAEMQAANKFKNKQPGKVILWVLSGSSVHKFWPYQDQVIARILLEHPTVTIVLVGDTASQLLEQGWENEPRVKCKSGKWSVRETLAFCSVVDVIVTLETGVFLGVQFADVPKVLLLSHSSKNNYADEMVSCFPITPDGCDCYPCHQMHYGFEHCSVIEMTDKDNNTATVSKCQALISPEKVYSVIRKLI